MHVTGRDNNMTTRSFLVNLLEIVDEARLRIPIVRDIKLPGFSLVMECFLPSTPPLSLSLSLSPTVVRSFVYRTFSSHRSHVCNETLQIHTADGFVGKYLNPALSTTILFRSEDFVSSALSPRSRTGATKRKNRAWIYSFSPGLSVCIFN